jgi:hypothetical protein
MPPCPARLAQSRAGLEELAPIVERARSILDLATGARARRVSSEASSLQEACVELLAWRSDMRTRVLIQECLGASFLPRMWRIGIDLSLRTALWRPLLLATHELVRQADVLTTLARGARAPRRGSGQAA